MSHRPTLALALGAALLAGAPGAAQAQDVPPPPGAPGAPTAPTPPPSYPTVPIAPGGGLGPGIPPPPPPPPLEAPGAPAFPATPQGLAPVVPMTPAVQAPPVMDTTPPIPGDMPTAPKSVTLRYKFSPGQTVRYTLTADVDGSVQVGAAGTTVPIKEHLEMSLHQTVKDVRASDGAATLAVQVDTMALTMNGQAMPLPPQTQQQMKQPTTLVMTPAGTVLSYQAPTGAPGMSSMGINPTDMQNARALPDKAVSQGDTWRSSFASEAVGLTTYAAYTLDHLSTDGATATIGQKLYGEFKPTKAGVTGATPMPKMNGLMTGTGTELFDITAGQVADQTADLQLKLTVTPPTPTPTSVKTQFHITTDMERVTDSATTPAKPAPSDEPPTGQLQ